LTTMKWEKSIKSVVVGVGAVIGLLALVSAVVVISGVTIRLDFLRSAIEKGAAEAMGRPVKIEGPIELVPTLRPTVTVSGVAISNPPDWPDQEFVSVALARTQIDIPDLLAKEITIGELTAQGVAFHLTSDAQGLNNWAMSANERQQSVQKAAETQKAPTTVDAAPEERSIRFTAIDRLSLTDIAVYYQDAIINKTVEFKIDEFSGSAKAGEPVQFVLDGSLQGHEYSFRIDGGSLESLRDRGSAWPLKFSGTVVGTPVEANGELDRQADEPKLHLGFSLGKVDIGAMLAWLKVADELEASTDRFSLAATLHGDSLNELVDQSEMAITLEGGQWTMKDPNTQARLPIQILEGSIRIKPEVPVSLNVQVKIDKTPVSFTIVGMPLADMVRQPEAMTVHIGAEAAGAKLALDGKLAMPIHTRDASLAMTFEGETLDSLEELIKIDLPPFGPYRLKARFAVLETGYELSNLHFKVGASELDGTMKLNTSGAKPLTEVNLTSKGIQLDDFSIEGWSPESGETDRKDPAPSVSEGRLPENDERTSSLLSPDVLNAFDAIVSIEVAQVLSGADELGGGKLVFAVQDGQFSMDPFRLDIPGGSVQVGFAYLPTASEKNVHLNTQIDRFDIGILIRRIYPERKLAGLLSLDVELDGTAPDLKHLLANTSGHVDFAFWPENLDAGIVDLWAVNLITVLSEQVDDEPSSTLNCMVAKFNLEEGLMKEKAIFMDTTRMSVHADSTIDFKTGKIDVLAVPKAKSPEYFSLATPVKIRGTFDDFDIGINKLSIAKTAVSFITSPITVPFKRLFSGKVPADGQVACEEAWRMEVSDD